MDVHDAPLMLSVSGARGLVGLTMTPAVAADFAGAFASHVRAEAGRASPVVCVGRDSRPSGEMLAAAAASGLLAAGCRVVDLGMVPTPTVGLAVTDLNAAGGLVITASHNPIEWNGLKFLNGDGCAPPRDEAEAIIARFRERAIDYVAADQVQSIARVGSAIDAHIARVLAAVDPAPVRAAGFRVVLDSVNGAGGVAGCRLLEQLGCDVVHINGEPTGLFAHTPEPTEANLVDLAERTAAEGAACGFAQDPDADRLAIIDETGRYIGEEYTLVLAAQRVLDQRGGVAMATNLSTSRMIDDLAARYDGARVLRAAVGEANVVEAMRGAGAAIGGEGNGGVIFPDVCWVRDSLGSMALILAGLAATGRPLSATVADLPRYCMIKRKFDLAAVGGDASAAIDRVTSAYDATPDARVDRGDGVRVDLPNGWVHLRPSNTEPIVRLMAEAADDDTATALIEEFAATAGLT